MEGNEDSHAVYLTKINQRRASPAAAHKPAKRIYQPLIMPKLQHPDRLTTT
jgi:hypothetical protein